LKPGCGALLLPHSFHVSVTFCGISYLFCWGCVVSN